jgi:hypothetical protein
MLGQIVVVCKGQNTIRHMLADPCLEAGTFRSVPGFAYGGVARHHFQAWSSNA